MSRFSILLIENRIVVSGKIITTLGHYLSSYTLSITKTISEATARPEPVQVILVDFDYLADIPAGKLACLSQVYPGLPILLLAPPSETASEGEILAALHQGASDYIVLSEPGLLSLGRRLAHLQQAWQATRPPVSSGFVEHLSEIINRDTSQLALQLIDLEYRVQAWNRASEILFGVGKEQVLHCLVDELPLSRDNLTRLKDIFDQTRAMQAPFSLPFYPLQSQRPDTRAVQVHAYPIYNRPGQPEATTFAGVCVVMSRLQNVREIEFENLYYNQELQILLEASREMSSQLELAATLEKVGEQTKFLLHGANCQIYFLEKDNKTLRPVHALGPLAGQIRATPLVSGQGLLGMAAAANKAMIIDLVDASSELPYPPDEALLCAPLTILKGMIGLVVVSRRREPFSLDDLRFFENLVHQASSAINNARLFEETQRSLTELSILHEANTVVSTRWDDQDVLNTLMQQIGQALHASRAFIAVLEPGQRQGFIEAEYIAEQGESPNNEVVLGQTLDLAQRPVLLKMISQQRPVSLHLSAPSLDEVEKEMMEKYGCFSRLLIPMVTKGETIGWLELWEMGQERTFTADEVRLGRVLSSQIAVAVQNKQHTQQTQRTLEETMALYRVANILTSIQDQQTIMTTVLQEYLQLLTLRQGSIVIFDFKIKQGVVQIRFQDEQPVRFREEPNGAAPRVLEGYQIPLQNNPVYERLMRSQQPVTIADPRAKWLTAPPVFAPNLELPSAAGWGDPESFAILVIPIKIRGEIIGAIVAENTRHERGFNQWDISLGQAMADQLSLVLQNVQLFEAEYQRREQAETLREVSAVVSSSLHLDEVLETILTQLARVIKYDSAAIHLIEGRQRRVIAGRGFDHLEEHIGLSFPVKLAEDEPGSQAIYYHRPLVFDNVSEIYPSFKQARHRHIKSWMGIPLIARDKTIGLISIDNTEVGAYSEEDLQLALAFANQVAVALENARLYKLEIQELERELEVAHQIQETLLPQFVPVIAGLDIAGRITPARQVGGDFFHFFSTNGHQLGIAIGDVSGKGIPAALYMAAGITAIDTQITPDVMPGELLNRLNEKLYDRLQENKMNIALQVATFMPVEGTAYETEVEDISRTHLMTVANAGMIAPIGAGENSLAFLPVGNLPIGALPSPEQLYTDEVFILDSSSAIIFTSDGIVEAQNEDRELFGFERLEETIMEIIGSYNADTIADHIIRRVQEFSGKAEQHDDMTVVVVVKK